MNKIIASSLEGSSSLDADEIKDIVGWFDISETDQEALGELRELTASSIDVAIDKFYDHVMAYPKAAEFFSDDDTLKRVKHAQKQYFGELVSGKFDSDYFEERRRLGRVHERVGVTPSLYMGGYSYYLDQLALHTLKTHKGSLDKAYGIVRTLMKVAHLDMALALETYVDTREQTIQDREREMQELPTPVLELREGLLLVPMVGTLDSYRASKLTLDLLEGIRSFRARVVVLDITGVSGADSAVANHLIQCMDASELMGVKPILTGISVDVAQSLVQIGMTRESLRTAGDLKRGLEFAEELLMD